jgi:hypothetical protein
MERICATILRSGGCGPSLWEENRRREKLAATPQKQQLEMTGTL